MRYLMMSCSELFVSVTSKNLLPAHMPFQGLCTEFQLTEHHDLAQCLQHTSSHGAVVRAPGDCQALSMTALRL